MSFVLKPGSKEAVEAGCTCPIMDNNHGLGFCVDGKTYFFRDQNCPLHGWTDEEDDEGVNDDEMV